MNLFGSITLGIIQGLTEFLPISSTGHLILASRLMDLTQTEFLKSFEIIIQLGSILAVAVLYWKLFLRQEIIKKLIAAFLPTALIGLPVYGLFKKYLLGNETIVLWALVLGGVALIVFELIHKERSDAPEDLSAISYKNCFLIGLCQAVAIVPGVSRSAATILGGLSLGLKRRTIVEFSFLLAVPTMLSATGWDLIKSAHSFSGQNLGLLAVGFILAFIVALLAIKFLIAFIKKHSFVPFGLYRIALALLFYVFVLK